MPRNAPPPIPSVEELRQEGHEVAIMHMRAYPALRKQIKGGLAPADYARSVKEALAGQTLAFLPPFMHAQALRALEKDFTPLTNAGETHVRILAATGKWAEVTVRCGERDSFSRRFGSRMGVLRALIKLGLYPNLNKIDQEEVVRASLPVSARARAAQERREKARKRKLERRASLPVERIERESVPVEIPVS